MYYNNEINLHKNGMMLQLIKTNPSKGHFFLKILCTALAMYEDNKGWAWHEIKQKHAISTKY